MKIITVSKLKLGQKFSWIPARWYGSCKLIHKARRNNDTWIGYPDFKFKRNYIYDLKFDAAVVNPPGVVYGVPGTTKVRLLKNGE